VQQKREEVVNTMVTVDRSTRAAGLVLTAVAALVLTACAGPAGPAGDFPNISLTETKSPAQLLRNEAAGRLPADAVVSVVEAQDVSVACLSEADDPDGFIRSWHSGLDVVLKDDPELKVADVARDLIASFTDQGWVARDLGGNATTVSKLLESSTSLADIQITGFAPNPNQPSTSLEGVVTEPTVEIQVHGPCVRTGGPNSDEVKSLEAE
jgi:hypothetical protein